MTERVIVDLSHPIADGMPVFPPLPSPRITALLDHAASRGRYGGQAEFHLALLELAGNTGTYIDSPFHRHRDGADLAAMPLEAVAGVPGIVVAGSMNENRSVDVDLGGRRAGGHAVLVATGWDRRWATPDYWRGPYLSPTALDALVRAEPSLVGVDFANADDVDDLARPVHTALLRAGIPIVENLRRLDHLPPDGFRFFAAPPAIVGGSSFPVRAFAEVAR